jgi:hypothetical protein
LGILSEWTTIWTQLREAAGGRSERGAIQGNRASWFRTNLSPTAQNPASATSGPFDVGRVTGRPLDEDTQYGIRQFSARSSNQKHKS